jgi:hypothetical protein
MKGAPRRLGEGPKDPQKEDVVLGRARSRPGRMKWGWRGRLSRLSLVVGELGCAWMEKGGKAARR